jgi:hypothetical protein
MNHLRARSATISLYFSHRSRKDELLSADPPGPRASTLAEPASGTPHLRQEVKRLYALLWKPDGSFTDLPRDVRDELSDRLFIYRRALMAISCDDDDE